MGMSPAQSEMWTLDPYGDRLVPTWTNSDGRMANAAVVYVPDSNAFALVGDMDAYKKRYGDAWDTVSRPGHASCFVTLTRLWADICV